MALYRKYLVTFILAIILLQGWIIGQEEEEKDKLAAFDSLAVEDTLYSESRRDSLVQPLDSTLLPKQKILDSLRALADSLTAPFYKQEVDSQYVLFMDGVQDYRENKFFEALKKFQKIYSIPKDSNRFKIASEMMLVKTNLRIGKISRALSLGYEFETHYGQETHYLDDVRYSIARALFQQKKYAQSLLYYLQVVKQFDDPQLSQKCNDEMSTLTDIFLTIQDLEKLEKSIDDSFYKPYIMLKLAEKYHEKGQSRHANQYLMSAYEYIEDDRFLSIQYEKTREYLEEVHSQKVYIGVILPLSGTRQSVAQPILKGVKYAINEIQDKENFDIAAIIMDNQGDFIRSVRQSQILVENPKVKAIFGPLSSKNTFGVAAVANQARIPFITPTATNSKITDMGQYGFQANVDFENLGRFIGKYCVEQTNAKNLVTLSPGGDFGVEMTDAFSKTIDKAGIKLLTQKWYSGTPENLGYHFKDIRNIGVELAREARDKKIEIMQDSLNKMVHRDSSMLTKAGFQIFPYDSSQYEVFHKNKMYLLNTHDVLTVTGLMDSTEFELPDPEEYDDKIKSIDAIFLPVKSENLEMIISQLDYYNIYARVLGNADWNNIEKLRQNRNLVDGMLMITDYYINKESARYRSFLHKYIRLMGESPRRFDLYGYDSIQPILRGVKEGHIQREALQQYMMEMPIYHGLARNISFKGNRPGVNSCAYILSYDNNQIKPVAEIRKGLIYPFE